MNINFNGKNFDFDLGNLGGHGPEDDRQHQPDEPKKAPFGKPAKPSKVRKPRSRAACTVRSLIVTLIFGALYYYLALPALNPRAQEFWFSIILLCVVYCGVFSFTGGVHAESMKEYKTAVKKNCKLPTAAALFSVAVLVIGGIVGWVGFHAGAYSSLLPLRTGDFAEEVDEVSWDQIPMLDSSSANTLANRKLGELSDLVSQFEVDATSAQINYQNAPVRVTYLNYGDFIKWIKNQSQGIPAYIVTDMRTQTVSVVRLEEGIRYSPSERFNRDLYRHLRFRFPTAMFGDVNFEVDEEGTPYWVASVEKKTIGLFGGEDIKGAVLVNAITGESVYYDLADIPTWVDRVFSSELVMTQYDYYGQYHNGFINSIFGQTGCTVTTAYYNYIAMKDDVWLYTGITSVGGDESNIGFILVNQRTKEAAYYSCAGATEASGMDSAQGAVQQFGYQATAPLLLNINGEPTYFMALKDASQLVKMYAMVNVSEYQIVATGSTVAGCLENYQALMAQSGIIAQEDVEPVDQQESATGTVEEIRTAVMDGNTTYFIRLAGQEVYYTITAAQAPETVILNVGDSVTVTYTPAENTQLLTASSVTR